MVPSVAIIARRGEMVVVKGQEGMHFPILLMCNKSKKKNK